jgi:hypothetical protein
MKGETLMTTDIDWKARAEAAEAREAALDQCIADLSATYCGQCGQCHMCEHIYGKREGVSPRAAQLLAAQRVAEAYDAYERRGGQDLFVVLAVELVSWRKAGQ